MHHLKCLMCNKPTKVDGMEILELSHPSQYFMHYEPPWIAIYHCCGEVCFEQYKMYGFAKYPGNVRCVKI